MGTGCSDCAKDCTKRGKNNNNEYNFDDDELLVSNDLKID